jgi:hypothetical protein
MRCAVRINRLSSRERLSGRCRGKFLYKLWKQFLRSGAKPKEKAWVIGGATVAHGKTEPHSRERRQDGLCSAIFSFWRPDLCRVRKRAFVEVVLVLGQGLKRKWCIPGLPREAEPL